MAVYIVSDSCECVWPGVGGWEGLACHEVFLHPLFNFLLFNFLLFNFLPIKNSLSNRKGMARFPVLADLRTLRGLARSPNTICER